jgi:DEAD/DEAH box helicase domain-containing protein
MYFEIFFDVETKKLFRDTQTGDPAELGVSIVSTYMREVDTLFNEIKGTMQSFWEKDFFSMWPFFEKADRIIGFNSINFDVQALKPYAPPSFAKLKHFDILDVVKNTSGKRLSLNTFAVNTLGKEKTDVGTNAVIYWNKGDKESLAKLKKYCEMDVEITRDIYDYGMKHKHLKYTDRFSGIQTMPIDFSYPKIQISNEKQYTLF